MVGWIRADTQVYRLNFWVRCASGNVWLQENSTVQYNVHIVHCMHILYTMYIYNMSKLLDGDDGTAYIVWYTYTGISVSMKCSRGTMDKSPIRGELSIIWSITSYLFVIGLSRMTPHRAILHILTCTKYMLTQHSVTSNTVDCPEFHPQCDTSYSCVVFMYNMHEAFRLQILWIYSV